MSLSKRSLSKGAVVVRQAHHERLDYPNCLCNQVPVIETEDMTIKEGALKVPPLLNGPLLLVGGPPPTTFVHWLISFSKAPLRLSSSPPAFILIILHVSSPGCEVLKVSNSNTFLTKVTCILYDESDCLYSNYHFIILIFRST